MTNQLSPPTVWEWRSTYRGVWGVVQVWARAPSERSRNWCGHCVIHGLPGAVHPLIVHGFNHLCCGVDNSRRVCRQPACCLWGLHGDTGHLSRPVVGPWQETDRYSTCLASRSHNYLKGSVGRELMFPPIGVGKRSLQYASEGSVVWLLQMCQPNQKNTVLISWLRGYSLSKHMCHHTVSLYSYTEITKTVLRLRLYMFMWIREW